MSTPAHNSYPVNQNAFQNEVAMQFVDGQQASAFTTTGDIVAWGQHPLANLDPLQPNSPAEAIIRTDGGPLYVKDGSIIDVTASEAQGKVMRYDVSGPNQQPPDIQIGSGWQYRFGRPAVVDGVLFRDGTSGQPQDPARRQSAKPNPFDEIGKRIAAVEAQERQAAQRRTQVAPAIGSLAMGVPRSSGRSPGRPLMRPYYRAAGR